MNTTSNRIPLSQHLQTLANRDEFVGLKVWNSNIKQVGTLSHYRYWDKNYFLVNYADFQSPSHIDSLSIDLTEQGKGL